MADTWQTVPFEPLPPKKKKEAHAPKMIGAAKRSSVRFGWPVCSRCGLVFLRNAETARAIKAGCFSYD